MRSFTRGWISLAAISGSLLLALPALADMTGDLLPNADGAYHQWSPAGTHYTRVDETPCNGTTDYVSTNTVGLRDSYSVNLSSIPDGSLITNIAITPCASRNKGGGGSSTLKVFYRYNGSNSADSAGYTLFGTTPTTLSASAFSGLSLQKTSTSALQIGAIYSAGTKGARLSRLAAVVTYTTLPAAPTNLSATTVATGTGYNVNLAWTDNANNETGFKVERGTDGVNFGQIATVGMNAASYVDLNRPSGTYYYRVRATNAAGNSAYSNTASAMVP